MFVSRIAIIIILLSFLSLLDLVDSFRMPPSSTGERYRPSKQCECGVGASSASRNDFNPGDDRLMHNIYDELATRLISRYQSDASSNKLKNNQLFVCIAGGPGSGKSTLSMAVAQRINEQMMTAPNDNDTGVVIEMAPASVVLPMDGFHYSRAQLQTIASNSNGKYTYDELLSRRGAPWTFDADGCIAAFTAARQSGYASLPIYSRVKSDPIPDGVQLHPTTRIVLLEGNYLLSWDDERWAPLRDNHVFDETWYIACKSIAEQRERLIRRHLETWSDEKTRMFGAGALGAGAKADANDMLNLEWIQEMSLKHADYVIESL